MKPERTIRFGSVHASIFLNEIDGDGGPRQIRNVNLQRRFKDSESGEWRSSSSFGLAELPQAMAALRLAMQHIVDKESHGDSESDADDI